MRQFVKTFSLLIIILLLSSCHFGASFIDIRNSSLTSENQLKIEVAPDGTGNEFQSISLFTGDTYSIYSVLRNYNGAFTENIAVTWGISGGAGTLTVNPDGKSAEFTATAAGQSNLTVNHNGTLSNYVITVSALPLLVTATTKTTSNATTSYVELVVDWNRSIAYAASRKPNICIEAMDFSNPLAPVIIGTIGSPTLQVCIGVTLFDNDSKMIVSGNSAKIAVWDLTSNPINSASWTSMGELNIGHFTKRFAGLVSTGTNQWDLYLATRFNGRKISLAIAGPTATLTNLFTYAPGGVEFNDATLLGSKMLIQSYTGVAQPIVQLNSNMTVSSSSVTAFWNWTAESNADTTKAFLGGDGGAFYGLDEFSNPAEYKRVTFDCWVRASDFAIQNNRDYLYALCSNGKLNVFDVTDIKNPTLVKTGQLTGFENEAYSIRVKPNSNDAIVVSNAGDFLFLNLQGLNATNAILPISP